MEHEETEELAPIKSETAVKGKGRVLVADDEPVVRDLVRTMLKELGYEVEIAIDGIEAIEIYRQKPDSFDLVVLDMIMPTMGGSDCLRELRQINPAVIAVLTTGYSSDTEIRGIVKEGWSGFIQKPYRAEAFSQVIKSALERK